MFVNNAIQTRGEARLGPIRARLIIGAWTELSLSWPPIGRPAAEGIRLNIIDYLRAGERYIYSVLYVQVGEDSALFFKS